MSKKIISGEVLENKMLEAINLLCDTVASTIGPSGNNVIINNSSLAPFITNDGVTIAESIESEDEIINTIISLAKEASIKTNEVVGDGTTTTLILLKNIFNEGIFLIKNGYSAISLKNDIDNITTKIIEKLTKIKRKLNKADLDNIATVSCGNEIYGKIISNLYNKTNNIKISLAGNQIETKIIKGYTLDSGAASIYFLNNKENIVLDNSYILISEDVINDIETIANILNAVTIETKSLLIIAEDYSQEVLNELILENSQNIVKVIAIKTPEYAARQHELLKDISAISNSLIFNDAKGVNLYNANVEHLGQVNKIIISKEETIVMNNYINKDYLKILNNKLKNEKDEYNKEFIRERIAKLNKGIGLISIGSATMTESKELKMRFDDAVCALNVSAEGVLPGGGISLLSIQNSFNNLNLGEQIVINSLDKPFKQIINNVGLNERKILENIKESNYHKLYNVKTCKYENLEETTIIDPFLVIKNSLINASSIAGMLLTTKYLIINESIQNIERNYSSEL